MHELVFISLPLEQFRELLKESIRQELQSITTVPSQEEKLLTREESKQLLGISLPTLHVYTKEGLIPAHRLGRRVLYKRSELVESLQKIKVHKHSQLR